MPAAALRGRRLPRPGHLRPYERLLGDALRGDSSLFAREDSVEEAWRVVQPVLGDVTPAHPYAIGTWGPSEADALIARDGGWYNPPGGAVSIASEVREPMPPAVPLEEGAGRFQEGAWSPDA